MVKSSASISCRCGNVEIQFTARKPRLSTECCCNHCYVRTRYLERLGGPSVPTRPLLTSKWEDRVTIIKGRDYLFCYKVTPKTLVYNVASSCCYTFLLGRHSVYDAQCVTTSTDFPIWKNADLPFRASSRWFSNQWGTERLAQYPPLTGIWVKEIDGSITGDPGWESVVERHMATINQEISEDVSSGETFDSIVESIGRDHIIIIPEEQKAETLSS